MAELRVVLNLTTEVESALQRHHHIAQHQVGGILLHGAEGAVGIEAADDAVVGTEQGVEVVGYLGVIIHHQKGLPFAFIRLAPFVLQMASCVGQGEVAALRTLFGEMFVGRIDILGRE